MIMLVFVNAITKFLILHEKVHISCFTFTYDYAYLLQTFNIYTCMFEFYIYLQKGIAFNASVVWLLYSSNALYAI